jgi:hypothetical protein
MMASFKRTVEITHGESLFIAQALQFYKENLSWKIGANNDLGIYDDEVDDQIEVANKIIPKFEVIVKEVN